MSTPIKYLTHTCNVVLLLEYFSTYDFSQHAILLFHISFSSDLKLSLPGVKISHIVLNRNAKAQNLSHVYKASAPSLDFEMHFYGIMPIRIIQKNPYCTLKAENTKICKKLLNEGEQ